LPPGRGDFLVQIPSDTLSRARAMLPSLLDNEPVETEESVLDPVDLLGGRSFRPRVADEDQSLLSLLPHPKKRRSMRDDVGVLDDSDGDDGDDPEPRRGRKGRAVVMYKVAAGDTLVGIAKQFAVDVDDVARENKIDEGSALKPGRLLKLRVHKDAIESASDGAARKDAPAAKDDEAKPSRKESPIARSSHDDRHQPRAKAERAEKDADDKSAGGRGRSEKKARRKARQD
jgi:membrane-bound lytic murein transglycosylase D